jgi:hypothetical protein
MSIPDLGIKFTEEILRSGYSTQFNNPNDKIIDENSSVIINKINELIFRKNIPKISQPFSDQLNQGVCCLGDYPFNESDLDKTVKNLGFPVHGHERSSGILILGNNFSDNYQSKSIKEIIYNLKFISGRNLRIYSQEMFIYSILKGIDFYSVEVSFNIENHISTHLLLQNIEDDYFSWPNTSIFKRRVDKLSELNLTFLAQEKGLLKVFGYQVGNKGLPKIQRRRILKKVYEFDLELIRNHVDIENLNEWSTPKSTQRLSKIAHSIAAFTRNAKRKTNVDYTQSISDWESDLKWLKEEYYDGRIFWPNTIPYGPSNQKDFSYLINQKTS